MPCAAVHVPPRLPPARTRRRRGLRGRRWKRRERHGVEEHRRQRHGPALLVSRPDRRGELRRVSRLPGAVKTGRTWARSRSTSSQSPRRMIRERRSSDLRSGRARGTFGRGAGRRHRCEAAVDLRGASTTFRWEYSMRKNRGAEAVAYGEIDGRAGRTGATVSRRASSCTLCGPATGSSHLADFARGGRRARLPGRTASSTCSSRTTTRTSTRYYGIPLEVGLHRQFVATDRRGTCVIVGAELPHGAGLQPVAAASNVKGYVRGFDVRTGELLVDLPRPSRSRASSGARRG